VFGLAYSHHGPRYHKSGPQFKSHGPWPGDEENRGCCGAFGMIIAFRCRESAFKWFQTSPYGRMMSLQFGRIVVSLGFRIQIGILTILSVTACHFFGT
jgi:hypothetical protein